MPCFGKPVDEDPEEYIKNNFGDQYSEYEYIIENLALTAVPKALLDEIPRENPKKKVKKKLNIKSIVSKKDKTEENAKSQNAPSSEIAVESNNGAQDQISEDPHSFTAPEDRIKKNKLFGPGCSQDVRYNPCYVHLCPDKDACTECKLGAEDKKDVLRRMLLPPGQRNPQQNPLKAQVTKYFISRNC